METFLFSIEQNLQREMYIFGYRTIFSAEDYIYRTGNYVDVNDVFSEAFFNGTIYGNGSQILNDTTYGAIINSINEKANKINVNITLSQPFIYVAQKDPWNVEVTFSVNLTMTDNGGLASWNKQENISALIGIEGFEDPIYVVNTNSKVSYKINRTLYSSGENVTNLSAHLNGRYYIAHNDAPSFLKRLAGSFTPDANGIESLVDLNKLSLEGIEIKQKSVVDHIYFSTDNPASFNIPNMPSWFRLDSAHIAKYNSTG